VTTPTSISAVDADTDICPLFAVRGNPSTPEAFLGTGFLIATGTMITCWHCVRDAVSQGLQIVMAFRQPGTLKTYLFSVVRDLAPDKNGSDLASGRVDRIALFGLELANSPIATGSDVWTYGYPLTEAPSERAAEWRLAPRYLQGYVTRRFYYGDRRIPSYELDMRAPAGLSGAPIVEIPSRRVVGVVYGVNEVGTIEQFGRVNPDTGTREPEIVRVEGFALAHFTETLRNLTGPATDGRELADFVVRVSSNVRTRAT
jgi:hypothetical protein